MLDAQMVRQPGARFQTVMTAQIIRDDENISDRIVGFDLFEQLNGVPGIARGRTPCDLLAITHPVDPDFVIATAVLQERFDAMAICRPARRRSKRAWDHRSELVGAEGRRSHWRRGVVGDDRGPDCGQSLFHHWFPNCGYDANACPRASKCAGPDCARPGSHAGFHFPATLSCRLESFPTVSELRESRFPGSRPGA